MVDGGITDLEATMLVVVGRARKGKEVGSHCAMSMRCDIHVLQAGERFKIQDVQL